jgi:hypothetical protein
VQAKKKKKRGLRHRSNSTPPATNKKKKKKKKKKTHAGKLALHCTFATATGVTNVTVRMWSPPGSDTDIDPADIQPVPPKHDPPLACDWYKISTLPLPPTPYLHYKIRERVRRAKTTK